MPDGAVQKARRMTYATVTPDDYASRDGGAPFAKPYAPSFGGTFALAFCALLGAWVLNVRSIETPAVEKSPVVPHRATAPVALYDPLLDSGYSFGAVPVAIARSVRRIMVRLPGERGV